MITQRYPLNKVNEAAEKYLQAIKTALPPALKKWQTFTTIEGDMVKVYNLIMTDKDQADAAQMHVMKTLAPFSELDGYSMKTELVYGAKDAFKAIGKSI
jgi:hypothetical protein